MDIGKLIKLVRILVYATAALGIAALLIFLALGDSRDPSYFYGTLAALPLFGLSIFLHYRLGRLKDLRFIRQQWGKVLERKRNFDNISLYHRFCPHLPGKAPVDDTTWQDLNMNELHPNRPHPDRSGRRGVIPDPAHSLHRGKPPRVEAPR